MLAGGRSLMQSHDSAPQRQEVFVQLIWIVLSNHRDFADASSTNLV